MTVINILLKVTCQSCSRPSVELVLPSRLSLRNTSNLHMVALQQQRCQSRKIKYSSKNDLTKATQVRQLCDALMILNLSWKKNTNNNA